MTIDSPETFWQWVDSSGGPDACWPWLRGTVKGYGHLWLRGATARRHTGAHRVALALSGLYVPDNLHVLHTCDNPPCCNPAHLYLGTDADNVRDMWARGRATQTILPWVRDAAAAEKLARTHCRHGHEYTPENTIRPAYRPDIRMCRTCRRLQAQASYARRKAAA